MAINAPNIFLANYYAIVLSMQRPLGENSIDIRPHILSTNTIPVLTENLKQPRIAQM